jgi:hypothetical protein
MNDFSMFVKEACQGGCEHDVSMHSVLCSWMGGLLSRASRALIDTRPSYGPQRAPNSQLLSLPAGVGMLSRRGETAWTFHFGVLFPP